MSNPGPSEYLISPSQNMLLGGCLSPFANSETKTQNSKWRKGPWVPAISWALSLEHFKSLIKLIEKIDLVYIIIIHWQFSTMSVIISSVLWDGLWDLNHKKPLRGWPCLPVWAFPKHSWTFSSHSFWHFLHCHFVDMSSSWLRLYTAVYPHGV